MTLQPSRTDSPQDRLPYDPFLLAATQIRIRLIHPIHPDRREHVDVEGVFERHRAMRHVRRNQQHFALAHDHLAAFEIKLQRAFDDISDLLAFVMMLRHHRVFLQIDVREHGFFAGHHFAGNQVAHLFERNRIPGQEFVSHRGYHTNLRMRTALILLTTLVGYVGVENLIFNTTWYPKIVNPDSSTGRVELFLWNEHKRIKVGPQVLAVGDSRMSFFPRFVNGDPQIGYTFATIAVAGSTPRDWYYMLREADPTRRRYSAILIPVEDYDDVERWENHANREQDLHYVIAHLRWSDITEFAGSFHGASLRANTALGTALKGVVYRADFQDLLKHRRARLAYADLARRESFGWFADYVGPDYNVSGIRIDWKAHTVVVPPGHRAEEERLFTERLFSSLAPYMGRQSAYLSYWFNRIYDLYRGTGTRIVFFRLPRGPYPTPDPPAYNDHSSVRRLAVPSECDSRSGTLLRHARAAGVVSGPDASERRGRGRIFEDARQACARVAGSSGGIMLFFRRSRFSNS